MPHGMSATAYYEERSKEYKAKHYTEDMPTVTKAWKQRDKKQLKDSKKRRSAEARERKEVQRTTHAKELLTIKAKDEETKALFATLPLEFPIAPASAENEVKISYCADQHQILDQSEKPEEIMSEQAKELILAQFEDLISTQCAESSYADKWIEVVQHAARKTQLQVEQTSDKENMDTKNEQEITDSSLLTSDPNTSSILQIDESGISPLSATPLKGDPCQSDRDIPHQLATSDIDIFEQKNALITAGQVRKSKSGEKRELLKGWIPENCRNLDGIHDLFETPCDPEQDQSVPIFGPLNKHETRQGRIQVFIHHGETGNQVR